VNISPFVAGTLIEFKTNGRIVIVGASLAGLRAAETLRHEGFNGKLTIIGDEKHEPYDRSPLSKQVLKGWVRPTIPSFRARVRSMRSSGLARPPPVSTVLTSRCIWPMATRFRSIAR
jgi:flavin-dependent dehydrogenase